MDLYVALDTTGLQLLYDDFQTDVEERARKAGVRVGVSRRCGFMCARMLLGLPAVCGALLALTSTVAHSCSLASLSVTRSFGFPVHTAHRV